MLILSSMAELLRRKISSRMHQMKHKQHPVFWLRGRSCTRYNRSLLALARLHTHLFHTRFIFGQPLPEIVGNGMTVFVVISNDVPCSVWKRGCIVASGETLNVCAGTSPEEIFMPLLAGNPVTPGDMNHQVRPLH